MEMFRSIIPIRFSDVDAFGHVNHTNFLTYCEDHRSVMFRQMGRECGSFLLDSGFSIVRIECDYLSPLLFVDHEVGVGCAIEAIGKSSIRLRYELEAKGRPIAKVRTVIVLTDGGSARPVSTAERSWLARFLDEADPTGRE